MAEPEWFVVWSHPQMESKANYHLRRQGFTTFYPHVSEWVGLSSRKSRLVQRPWLTNYLFVQTLMADVYRVKDTLGVGDVLTGAGDMPFAMPLEIMEYMFKKADPLGEVYRPGVAKPKFAGKRGDRFKINENSKLWGYFATIEQVLDNDRLIAMLDKAICGTSQVDLAISDVGELVKAETTQPTRTRPAA